MFSIVFLVCSVIVTGEITLAALPSDVTLCKAGDSDCISKITTDLLKKNPKGRPELGIPQVDPFHVKSLVISDGRDGPITLNLSFKDIDVEGISRISVERVVGFTKDPTTSKFELYGTLPQLRLRGNYKANGRILVLPIQGEGGCDITLEQVKFSAKFKPNVVKKNNQNFLEVNKLKILLEPSNLKIHLENLFNGDTALGENMNKFLNENSKDVWTELSVSVNNAVGEIIKQIIQGLFTQFSYDEVYQD